MGKINYSFMSVITAVLFSIFLMVPGSAPATDTESSPDQKMEQTGQQDRQVEQTDRQEQPAGGDIMDDQQEANQIVQDAISVLNEAMADPEKMIPASELRNAAGILIIPNVIKAGLVAGGRHGTGILVTRDQDKWNMPVFASITGGSLGAQIGVESADLFMVFRNQDNIQQIWNGDNLTLGADASVAAGSVGAKAGVSTRDAEILTYQRAEGLFAGASLTGSVINLDTETLLAYYDLWEKEGEGIRAYYGDEKQLVQRIGGMSGEEAQDQEVVKNIPDSARELQDALNQFISSGSQQ